MVTRNTSARSAGISSRWIRPQGSQGSQGGQRRGITLPARCVGKPPTCTMTWNTTAITVLRQEVQPLHAHTQAHGDLSAVHVQAVWKDGFQTDALPVPYQFRSSASATLSTKTTLCPHGICATTCCTNSASGYVAANFAMYFRFLTE